MKISLPKKLVHPKPVGFAATGRQAQVVRSDGNGSIESLNQPSGDAYRGATSADAQRSSPVDPRLRDLITALLRTEKIQRTDGTEYRSHEQLKKTVAQLWPKTDGNTLPSGFSVYDKPTATPPMMTHREFVASLKMKGVPDEFAKNIALVDVKYQGYDDKVHDGQIAVHRDLADSLRRVFARIVSETKFPMTTVLPVGLFGWADSASVELNNSSGFNWRLVSGTDEVSDHAFGAAVDINPLINPWMITDTENVRYDRSRNGTMDSLSDVVRIFKEEGWSWGGDWNRSKDWQHFYRPEVALKYFGKHEVAE